MSKKNPTVAIIALLLFFYLLLSPIVLAQETDPSPSRKTPAEAELTVVTEPVKKVPNQVAALQFFKVAADNFAKWDLNHDGDLSVAEVNRAIFDSSNKGDAACVLSALHSSQRLASKTAANGDKFFTSADFVEAQPETKQQRSLVNSFIRAQKKLARHGTELFSPDAPKLSAMRQGKTGDCYLLASLGSMVVSRPAQVRSMIRTVKGGKYMVSFPGAEPIIVDAPSEAEMATFGESGNDGIWLNVYEKAFAKLRISKTPDADENSMYDKISGGRTGSVIKLITGHKTQRFDFKSEKARSEVRAALSAALREHRLVTTGVKSVSKTGAKSGHALAVVAYDPEEDQVRIWNPWGTSIKYKAVDLKMDNGLFSMTVFDWMNRFSSMVIESSEVVD